ncbi:hypothetical protein [Streptomyces sp. NPDC058657]|uniref:hypothetical protein n=1 Tax=unclassified Streptomyces TaxID=2593676 RepID=UPI0036590CF9
MILLAVLCALTLGYVVGRWKPAYRTLSWALRESALDGVRYESGRPRPTNVRYRAARAVQRTDVLLWFARHPLDTWRYRSDQPITFQDPTEEPS